MNLSMINPIDNWNPFHLLLERDSQTTQNPDLSFISKTNRVPVVGVVQVGPQHEYGEKAKHDEINQAIKWLTSSREMSIVTIDTELCDQNVGGLRTSAEIESLIAKMDLVITTRLHGLAFSIQNEVPVIALDAIEGGAKVTAQAKAINWPLIFNVGEFDNADLSAAFDF